MAKSSKKGKGGGSVRRIGGLRVPERFKRQAGNKKAKRGGLPESAWGASKISGPSKSGHQQAGPIMQYGDDT